ncbi:MAG TPA: HipA N-terminal domain-containing protein, partial [Polyangiaceae bacterium]|nr:HipA N-terminal domain-containing protein [Polyangiaceae bacterium]
MDILPVRFAEQHVAELTHDRGRFTLRYAPSAGRAVSQRLPVRDEPYSDEACRSFFINLLPEAG